VFFSQAPFTKKHEDILRPIHQLYSSSSNVIYEGYKMALESVTQLYHMRTKGMMHASSYGDTLSSQIQFKPITGTTMKAWLKDLRTQGIQISLSINYKLTILLTETK